MPRDSRSKRGQNNLQPQFFVSYNEDAVTHRCPEQHHRDNLGVEGYCLMFTEVANILAKEFMVEQPLIQTWRRLDPHRRREQQKGCCGKHGDKDPQKPQHKRHTANYYKKYSHCVAKIVNIMIFFLIFVIQYEFHIATKLLITTLWLQYHHIHLPFCPRMWTSHSAPRYHPSSAICSTLQAPMPTAKASAWQRCRATHSRGCCRVWRWISTPNHANTPTSR